MVVSADEVSTTAFKRFSSNEAGSNAPYLAITYNYPPGIANSITTLPKNGGYVNTTTPTLEGTFYDNDAGTVGEIQYNLNHADGTSLDVHLGSAVPIDARSKWTVPASDNLTDGTTYQWWARAYDGIDYGLPTPNRTFTVDTTPPSTPNGQQLDPPRPRPVV